jgi:hypothetical protein
MPSGRLFLKEAVAQQRADLSMMMMMMMILIAIKRNILLPIKNYEIHSTSY